MTTKEKPLVTIATITFNLLKAGRKNCFRQNLESVHNQTYENIEHIIVDGASTDGTVDLIKEYAEKGWVKYISEPDSGIYNAMNKGMRLAKGKYIAFLNSDDFYHNPDAVCLSVEALEREKSDFSYADFVSIDGKRKETVKGGIEKFLYTMPFGHPTMFVKTSVIREENGFNEKYGLPADYDLVIRLILKDRKGVYINDRLATYRIGGLGCAKDHSDEIARIYFDNYSVFQKFSNIGQAKRIMYELKMPVGFVANFKKFASGFKNINIEKVAGNLVDNLVECKEKTDLNDFDQKKGGIPVFLSSDNDYAPFVATTIASIMDNTSSHVDFYILDGGISVENAEKIKNVKKKFPNFSLEFIEIDTKNEFKNFPTRLHFSIDMYTRYLIPQLKPLLKKVIYSDVDVIFNGDIKNLYEEDLKGHIIGAVPYTFGYLNPNKEEIRSYHKRLDLSDKHKYFESGLLLIDCEKWRNNNITEKLLIKVKNSNKDVILTPDQDTLNMVFENDYRVLDNKYIVVPNRVKIMLTNKQMRASVENPFIFHFAGSSKPWIDSNIAYAEHFWKYARITPFYEYLIFNLAEEKKNKTKNIKTEEEKKNANAPNKTLSKLKFAFLSPRIFFRKYSKKLLNSLFR